MQHETILRFSQDGPMLEEMLLFSVDGSRAVEARHEGFRFGGPVQPLYPGSKVTQPVPVMVEGTYHVFDRAKKQFVEVTITAQDILDYHKNTPRDVAINYEHKHGADPVGWLRLRDTAVCKPLKTASGEKMALYASLELFGEAASKVERGVYRDGSIELRPYSKEIIGHALTGYPVMRDVQFYGEFEEPVQEPAPSTPAAPAAEETPASSATAQTPTDQPPKEDTPDMTEAEALAAALQKYGLRPEDLSALPALIADAEAAKKKAALTLAREAVQKFSTDEAGNVRLTGTALDAAAQLYVFCSDHADLQFGEGDDATNPQGLVERLLAGIQAVQVFGETPGPSVTDIQGQEPKQTPADQQVDEGRVSDIRARIKANLRLQDQ